MLGLFVRAWSTAVTYGEDTLEWTCSIRCNLKLSVLFLLLHLLTRCLLCLFAAMLPHSLFITATISAGVQWSCKVTFHLRLIDPEPPDRPLKHTSMQLPSAKVESNVSLNRSFLLPLSFGMISLQRFFQRHMTLPNLNLILINIFAPFHNGSLFLFFLPSGTLVWVRCTCRSGAF